MEKHEWQVAVRSRARERGGEAEPLVAPMRTLRTGGDKPAASVGNTKAGATFRPFGVADKGTVDDWLKHRESLIKAAGPKAPRPPPSSLVKAPADSPANRYRKLRGGRRMSGTMMRGLSSGSRHRIHGVGRVSHN